jgi:RibD C-terminal domain
MADRSQDLGRDVTRQRYKEIGKSHGGIASNEDNRHTGLDEGIRGVVALRKLKLQVQMSVDSYIAGPKGEMDWIISNWDDKLKKYVFELTEPVDTIVLGRKMTDGFISYWSDVMTKPYDPSYAFAKKMIETPKVVFTKTLKKS